MTERQLQVAAIELLRLNRDWLVFHVRNEGRAGVAAGRRNKREGMLAGVPDIVVQAGPVVAYIELKTPTGRLSAAQVEFREYCATWGVSWYLCRSVEDVYAAALEVRKKMVAACRI